MKKAYYPYFKIGFALLFSFGTCFSIAQTLVPPAGKTLLIIGQDLKSIYDYKSSGYFPEPGGVTSYMSLYDVANPSAAFPYGGMGENLSGQAASDVDWGAGPLNTRNAALGFANSTLALGIYMTEDYFPGGLSKIANGTYDTEINRLAAFLKSINKPVFLRIGYEFDGKWNTGYENTTNYKNAFKHIVDLVRAKAPKVMMVLQACTSPVDDILENNYHENIEDWYPGDQYVDYLGYSWFLNTTQQVSLTDELLALAKKHNKPVMASESAPQGYDLKNLTYRYINTMLGGAPGTNPVSKTPGQIWNEWFKPFFQYIHTHSDQIKVAAYINCNWDSQAKWGSPYNEGYWGDSRVEANADIRAKWLAEINQSSWLHGSSTLFDQLAGNSTDTTITTDPDPDTTSNTHTGYAPATGKTLLMVGQTYTNEYKSYVNAFPKAPAGSSHYGEIYNGKINQGDDANNEAFLGYIEQTYPNAFCELAISIKDNPAAGGYSGENAVWKACKDITAGKWNSQIDLIASRIKARPSLRFLLRIDYEVSLNMFANKTTTPFVQILDKYNAQGINPLEKADQVTEFDLKAYPDAFNYVANRIRETNHVSNVEFVFHPVRGFNDAKWLYPGDAYTDWYGISLFNHDMCYPTWEGTTPPFVNCPIAQAMDDNVKQSLTWAKNTIKKPIMISESAVQAELDHQHNAAFMKGYLDKITSLIEQFDVKAWVYINSNWVGHNWSSQWGDSRVESIQEVRDYWWQKVSAARYIHYEGKVVTSLQSTQLNQAKVYPNPFEGTLHIQGIQYAKVEIFNLTGAKVYEKESISAEEEIKMDGANGMYFLKITRGDQIQIELLNKR